jgi:phage host-nuclease inhibitor protein Gam
MTEQTAPTTDTLGIAEGTRLLRRLAEHHAAIDRVTQDANAQIAEITEWRDSEIRQHEREIDALEARLQPCVDAELARNPLKRKSVRFPSGAAGYRTPPPHLVVEDVAAFVAWAQQRRPNWLRTRPPEPALRVISEEATAGTDGALRVPGAEPGEIEVVPGVRVQRSAPTFYAKPGVSS